MRIRRALAATAVGAALAVGAAAAPAAAATPALALSAPAAQTAYTAAPTSAGQTIASAQAQTSSLASIPPFCSPPRSDSNYVGVQCNTQRIYKVKAYCDSSDGRHTTLTGNEASNNGWSTIHCNTLGAGWHYRPNSVTVIVR